MSSTDKVFAALQAAGSIVAFLVGITRLVRVARIGYVRAHRWWVERPHRRRLAAQVGQQRAEQARQRRALAREYEVADIEWRVQQGLIRPPPRGFITASGDLFNARGRDRQF